MAIHDHLPAQTLVESHTPLVTYAVRAVAPRLPDATAVDALVAAGMAGLRTAAITHAAAGRDGAGFAAFAKRQITAALAGALAGDTATPAMAAPAAARADALSYMESISGDSALLAAAHPAAFGTPPSAPRHQAGHYAAVAAASDFRSSRDIQTAQQPNAAQLRAFGT